MQVTKTLVIVPTGVLNITLTPRPIKGYSGVTNFYVDVDWKVDGIPGGYADIFIEWETGIIFEERLSVSPPQTFGPYAYGSNGIKTIIVTISDLVHGIMMQEKTVTVEIVDILSVTFTSDKNAGPVPLVVTFTNNPVGGFLGYTWTLDPGDGSAPYGGSRPAAGAFTQVHTYNKIGTWTATLKVTDALGATYLIAIPVIGDLLTQIKQKWDALPGWQKGIVTVGIVVGIGAVYLLKNRR